MRIPLFILVFITLHFPLRLFTQTISWNTNLVIHHPEGFTDTLSIGCDEEGAEGFQPELDSIDTVFAPPVRILSYDQLVGSEFGISECVNLRRDIKGFTEGYVVFTFYVLHDDDGFSGNPFYLTWDTADFRFDNGEYQIQEAWIESTYGYIQAIDGTSLVFCGYISNELKCFVDSADLIPESIVFECSMPSLSIMRLDLYVGFNVIPTGLDWNESQQVFRVTPNPTMGTITVLSDLTFSGQFSVHSLNGQLLKTIRVNHLKRIPLSLEELQSGMYLLIYSDSSGAIQGSTKIMKL